MFKKFLESFRKSKPEVGTVQINRQELKKAAGITSVKRATISATVRRWQPDGSYKVEELGVIAKSEFD